MIVLLLITEEDLTLISFSAQRAELGGTLTDRYSRLSSIGIIDTNLLDSYPEAIC